MKLNRPELKIQARKVMAGSKPSIMWVSLVYILLSLVMSTLSSKLMSSGITVSEANAYMQYFYAGNVDGAVQLASNMTPPTAAVAIYLLLKLVLVVVSFGFTIFTMNTVRRNAPVFGNLLDGFGMLGRVLLLYILKSVIIGLGYVLLIVPGVFLSYSFRQADYLLIDHPELSVWKCMTESFRLMKGHRWELFVLDLSFIGWYLLLLLPVVSYAAEVFTLPYFETTYVLYYDRLTGIDYSAQSENADYTDTPDSGNF